MRHHDGSGSCCGGSGGKVHGHGMGHGAGHGRGWRRFVSPAEERGQIEHYISELEKELAGATARLEELAGK